VPHKFLKGPRNWWRALETIGTECMAATM